MKIENNTDFANWNNSVNHAMQQCDLQDVFARSDLKTLKQLFLDQNKNEKKLSIFAINKCMGSDMLLDFINVYARNKAESWITEYEADEGQTLAIMRDELFHERQSFESEKVVYQTKFDGLNKELDRIRVDRDRISKLSAEYFHANMNLKQRNRDLNEEIEKLYAFESHIKELLTETQGMQLTNNRSH